MSSQRTNKANRGGFTLAEMMAVIVIIGLLATIVVPNVLERWREAAKAKARVDIATLSQALAEFAVRNGGRFPDALEALTQPDESGYSFLQSRVLPTDPWKQEYLYEPPNPGAGEPRPRVSSMGPDGQPDTSDDLDNLALPAAR